MKKFAVLLAVAIAAIGAGTAVAGSALWVKTAKTSLGTTVVNPRGLTLYLYEGDTKTKSACTGGCLKNWPPLMASGSPAAGGGAKTSMLGTLKRGSGKQATYNGHPLYTFIGDSKAGQVNGEGLKLAGKLWYAVSPSGGALMSGKSSSGGSTSTGW